ncbi:MAG TPA: DUF6154 family protein [Bacillota bacterium]|nr:DUF6154 family protein [Bacillota bacterium]
MKFIDDLYNLYRDHLTGDEEDAVAIVIGVLQELEKEELHKLVGEMNEDELFHMLSLYLIELMRKKMAQEGVGSTTPHTSSINNLIH